MRNLGRGLIYPSQRPSRWHYRARNNYSVSPQKKGEKNENQTWQFIALKKQYFQKNLKGYGSFNDGIAPSKRSPSQYRLRSGRVSTSTEFRGYTPSFSSFRDASTVCQARLARRAAIFALGINGGKVGKPNYRPESLVDCSPRGG